MVFSRIVSTSVGIVARGSAARSDKCELIHIHFGKQIYRTIKTAFLVLHNPRRDKSISKGVCDPKQELASVSGVLNRIVAVVRRSEITGADELHSPLRVGRALKCGILTWHFLEVDVCEARICNRSNACDCDEVRACTGHRHMGDVGADNGMGTGNSNGGHGISFQTKRPARSRLPRKTSAFSVRLPSRSK